MPYFAIEDCNDDPNRNDLDGKWPSMWFQGIYMGIIHMCAFARAHACIFLSTKCVCIECECINCMYLKHLMNSHWCCFCCWWLVIANEKLISLVGNEIRRIDSILMAFIIAIYSKWMHTCSKFLTSLMSFGLNQISHQFFPARCN